LLTFIVRLSGNPGQQVRFQMPATVDQALHIAVTVFEAEAQEKKLDFFFKFRNPQKKVEAILFSPGRPLEDQSMLSRSE